MCLLRTLPRFLFAKIKTFKTQIVIVMQKNIIIYNKEYVEFIIKKRVIKNSLGACQ